MPGIRGTQLRGPFRVIEEGLFPLACEHSENMSGRGWPFRVQDSVARAVAARRRFATLPSTAR